MTDYTNTANNMNDRQITVEEKTKQLIDVFGVELAIKCCDEVLGYMGSDRGYNFWSEVKFNLQVKQNKN